nr:MAG TPA: hypothetical protein [Caudoviricetes sp.]
MSNYIYTINENEAEVLARYEGTLAQKKDPHRYDTLPKEDLATLCRIKDKSNDLFVRRYEAARAVIDIISRQVGIDPDTSGLSLYYPDFDGSSAIARRIEEWVSRSGEKAVLKKRVQELEQENLTLRSLILK